MPTRIHFSKDTLLKIPKFVRRGMSQRQIAEKLGVSQPTVGRLLRGEDTERIWPEFTRRLAEARAAVEEDRRKYKKCTKCGEVFPKTVKYFHPISRKCGFEARCRSCKLAAHKAYNTNVRLEVLAYYGDGTVCCACCGEDHIEFLSIDHINGGGNYHRRAEVIGKYASIYLYLKANNFPDGFRVLCMNCNTAIGFHGSCPHQQRGVADIMNN